MFVTEPSVDILLRGVILTTLAMAWVVALVRINGLRSFSKMTNFDFVMTVAVGSLLASSSQSTEWKSFVQSVIAMATLFLVQFVTAVLRKSSRAFESLVQNEPVILMRNGQIFENALLETRVARQDLIAKLRENSVGDFSQVRAVILETTGDVSVIKGDQCNEQLLEGTRRPDQFT